MTENIINNEITNKPYWELYYKNKTVDIDVIKNTGKVYDHYWSTCINEKTASVIEIGAFPGRYLAYLADKYKLHPTGLDFQSDLSLIEQTFEALGIKDYGLINEDFLKWEAKTKYDLVLSIGFVEHFENYEEVIAKHFQILNENGEVFFQIPNKRYLRKWYGMIADRENLKAHNLRVMSLKVFEQAAIKNGMEIKTLEYFGPFQYALHGMGNNAFRKFMFNASRFLFKTLKLNRLVEKYPSKFWSASIICILKKK